MTEQPADVLRWRSLEDFIPGQHFSGKVAVVGHSPQTSGAVLNLGHLLCIDTFVQGGGWLTAIDMSTAQVWQADERGRMRGDQADG